MSILLGTYGKLATPFYLYTYKSDTYLSLKDINFIFFNQQLDTKIKLVDCNPSDFIREKSTGNILILTCKLIRIARYFNSYSLAELCKLSLDEILGKVAQPLLNTIHCDHWKPSYTTLVERDLQFESLCGDEWPAIAPPVASAKPELAPPILMPPFSSSSSTNPIYNKWLSFNLYENYSTPEVIQALLLTAKTSKQQQAIIESRQRKTAFTLSRVNHSKQKLPSSSKKRHHDVKSKLLPPSPPQTAIKRTREIPTVPHTSSNKRLKILETVTTTTTPVFDNLTLLATQATQLRGLLLSPEVSPPHHHHYPLHNQQQQHRLPSLQTLLSDLKNHPFP